LSEYWDEDQSTKSFEADVQWAEENDIDWEEIIDRRMN
jgi:hypothetical protein